MSKIITRSVFYYGTGIRTDNRYFDFEENSVIKYGELTVGDYTLTEFAQEWERAFNVAGDYTYSLSFDRDTRRITIQSSNSGTSYLSGTGPRIGQSVWATGGFDLVDHINENLITSESGAGSEYETQYPVEKYISADHSINLENAAYNVTPSGIGQVASFGDGKRIELDIRLITEKLNLKNEGFLENANGINDFMTFIESAMKRDRLEFMHSVDDRDDYLNVLLESTQEDRNGVRFILKNMDTPEFYHSGKLTFRKLLL